MTRVSVLGSWRKGEANVERGSGLYLKRAMTNNYIQVVNVHEGDGLMEYEGYEYIGPLDITGVAKTSENTQELSPGYYLYKGPHDSQTTLIHVSKKKLLESGETYIGPIFSYCISPDDLTLPKNHFYTWSYSPRTKLHTYTLSSPEGPVLEVSGFTEAMAKSLFQQVISSLFPGETE